jgi:trehalose 6-phosphate synthase/phosphatase
LSYRPLTPYDLEPGSFIEPKKFAITWHYRRADPEFGAFQASECHQQLNNTVAKKYDIEVMAGKANLEVRPKFVNKGEIVERLIVEYGEGPGDLPEFVLCLGDDSTDEGKSLYISFYSDLFMCVC